MWNFFSIKLITTLVYPLDIAELQIPDDYIMYYLNFIIICGLSLLHMWFDSPGTGRFHFTFPYWIFPYLTNYSHHQLNITATDGTSNTHMNSSFVVHAIATILSVLPFMHTCFECKEECIVIIEDINNHRFFLYTHHVCYKQLNSKIYK
jgi:hypothetical protein